MAFASSLGFFKVILGKLLTEVEVNKVGQRKLNKPKAQMMDHKIISGTQIQVFREELSFKGKEK